MGSFFKTKICRRWIIFLSITPPGGLFTFLAASDLISLLMYFNTLQDKNVKLKLAESASIRSRHHIVPSIAHYLYSPLWSVISQTQMFGSCFISVLLLAPSPPRLDSSRLTTNPRLTCQVVSQEQHLLKIKWYFVLAGNPMYTIYKWCVL